MKHAVIIALGSNICQNAHIQWASQQLERLLSDCKMSSTLWTEDIKGSGKMYMNRLVCGHTEMSVKELERSLKELEAQCGRLPSSPDVPIDLDLMQYDQRRYHQKDWERPYIQNLIPDII